VTRAAHAGHTGYHGIEHAKTTTAFQRFGALLRGIALSAQRIRNALRKRTDLLYDVRACSSDIAAMFTATLGSSVLISEPMMVR
jgi:hypothetical protein